MPTDNQTEQPLTNSAASKLQPASLPIQWLAILLATIAIIGFYAMARHMPYGDLDGQHYLAMANGQPEMKPFAVRFLTPAIVRIFAHITGSSADRGFLVLGLLSGWVLLYGVLSLVLRRHHGITFAFVLILLPFWLRSLINYQLPDLPHAALCMVYLLLLRRRRWGSAAGILAIMYFTRESTLLIACVAMPVLWLLAEKSACLMQLAGLAAGIVGSKFATRHALANHQGMSDMLYMLGKIPWNLSRLLGPLLGAAQTRLLDYGWPLFLVYLPAVILTVWRNAPRWAVCALVVLNFIDAWTDLFAKSLGRPYPEGVAVFLCCNLIAAWLLLKYKPRTIGAITAG